MTTMCVKQLTPRQQVTRYMREIGGKSSGGKGWVSISRGEWSETFDTWGQALTFLVIVRNAHIDTGAAWPWDAIGPAVTIAKFAYTHQGAT